MVARRPASLAVWALVWLILGVGPVLLMLDGLIGRMTDFMSQAESLQHLDMKAAEPRILALEAGLWSLMGPWWVWAIIVQTVLLAALYRSMLEPQKRKFAYLRIGGDELRLFATALVLVILCAVFYAVFCVVVTVLVITTWNYVAHPWAGWLAALEIIAAICFALYLPFKFSLALPATFAEKKIRIFESWKLTGGAFWKIVGMVLLTLIFTFAVAMIGGFFLRLIGIGVLMGTTGWGPIQEFIAAVKGDGGNLASALRALLGALGPMLIVVGILQGALQILMFIVFNAPFAAAYAALSGRSSEN